MERLLSMLSNCSAFVLLTVLILITAQPVMADKKDEQIEPSVVATAPIIVSALARQIAFVKTFSVDYPYQYERESTHNEKTGE